MKQLIFRLPTRTVAMSIITLSLASCASISNNSSGSGSPNMGSTPSKEERALAIQTEATGAFYYGRRYHVNKTRFWGYLRKPRTPWATAKLVVMNESSTKVPDRIPEDGPASYRHGYDQNFDYQVTGSYTGRKIYDPNSNLFLPEFRPTGFKLLSRSPGWLFSPNDYYNSSYITLVNDSVRQQQ